MKKTLISLFYFLCLLSFFLLTGCGSTEDSPETVTPLDLIAAETESHPSWDPTLVAYKTNLSTQEMEAVRLRAKNFRDELSTGKRKIPPDWYTTEDPILRAEYLRAQLVKQFGDIPQVHTVAEWHLKAPMGITRVPIDEYIAFLEAQLHLWPSDVTRRTLENARNRKKNTPELSPQSKNDQLQTENPQLWAKLERERLIQEHGDIPQVHIIVDYNLKWLLGQPITDDEYLNYLEGVVHLDPGDEIGKRLLTRYQKAKADGIPFKDVNIDDIIPPEDNSEDNDE